ncbi:MAG: MBL fold metallo-hydrolase [Candidatus Buchananbacteria bacterium]
MAKVKVLIEGYAREENGIEQASSTTVLIKDGDLNIVVDPGCNKPLLLESLAKENLTTADINYVFLSHYHFDHSLLAGIFERALVLYADEAYDLQGGILEPENIFSDDIEIIKTPGHNSDCRTMLVKTEEGIIAVCEDVFWWADDEEQKTDRGSLMEHDDPYAKNKEDLMASREKVLAMADYIIPGHGKMFRVEK